MRWDRNLSGNESILELKDFGPPNLHRRGFTEPPGHPGAKQVALESSFRR